MAASKRSRVDWSTPGSSVHGEMGSAALIEAIHQSLLSLPRYPTTLAAAVSGGPDSAMLAVHAALLARQHGIPLHLFHVHHGLQAPADRWRGHVHDLAQRLAIPCHSVCVEVKLARGDGMEEAARHARYQALHGLAGQTGVQHVLLAHHRNDQAETVLLRLLRGAGPTGLAAMSPASSREGVMYLRPWLDVDRSKILEQCALYEAQTGWCAVTDPSNADDRYTRAALRERLVPHLDARWPGWQGNVARHARLSTEAAQVLAEVARSDLQALEPGEALRDFSLARWRELSAARQAVVLRHWLAVHGIRAPTEARLHDWMRQLRGLHALGHDRQMRVKHGSAYVVCRRGRVALELVAAADVKCKKS